jgi:transcriptional regulator with XRE-family HTH domain
MTSVVFMVVVAGGKLVNPPVGGTVAGACFAGTGFLFIARVVDVSSSVRIDSDCCGTVPQCQGVFVEKLHERLRAELAAKNLSAAQAARDAGEPDSQGLRDVLAGRKRLSAELLSALVVGTGIDGDYVLTGKTVRERASDAASGLSARLRSLREQQGLEAVLKVAAVTADQWRRFEEGDGVPQLPPGTLQRLIEGFNVDASDLLLGSFQTLTTNRTEETLLLQNYRACSPPDQETIRQQAQFLAQRGIQLLPDGRYPNRVDMAAPTLHDKPRRRGSSASK